MYNFTSVHDVVDIEKLLQKAIQIKSNSLNKNPLGKGKTLGLLFFNPSLRTRLSTQKAAYELGMNVIVLDLNSDSWKIEFNENVIMNGDKTEHIKEAAGVISSYCDVVGLRSFPSLKNKESDYNELILNSFLKYLKVPLISLESATRHPLQSFADLITIREHQKNKHPKIVLAWAPHIKALPQAVPNSFSEWMLAAKYELTIAQPKGYELSPQFTNGAKISYELEEAIEGADFIYVKNWSSFKDYGQTPTIQDNWLLNQNHLTKTNAAKILHCLPVRRNLELLDELIDGEQSLIQEQAFNRAIAAQTVLDEILNSL